MKIIFNFFRIFFLFCIPFFSHSQNSIIAIINDDAISLNEFENFSINYPQIKNRKDLLDKLIDHTFEKSKIRELKIIPAKEAIRKELINIAKLNNLTLEQLELLPDFKSIYINIAYSLSKIALMQLIVSSEKKANPNSNFNDLEVYQNWLRSIREKAYIEVYEKKLEK